LCSWLEDTAIAPGWESRPAIFFTVDNEDRAAVMKGFLSGTDVEITTRYIEQMKKEKAAKAEASGGSGEKKEKKGGHSVLMDFYAMGARKHMQAFGTTQRQLAVIASKAHNNSTLNPLAQYTFPQSVEEVMADYEVAYPLTRGMRSPVGDGSAAAILCSDKFLKTHPSSRAIAIRASVLRSGSWLENTISAHSYP
jgi:acetyl-CoA acetyltransferase